MNRIAPVHGARIAELWRYSKVGVVNTAFGFGLYVLLVYFGLNLFVAQIVAHVIGATFNYFMLKVHVFKGSTANIISYIGSYIANYIVGLTCLAILHHFIKSPYLAGLFGLFASAMINYFILKNFVFKNSGSVT